MNRDDIQALIQKDYADKTDISEEDKMTRFELMYRLRDPAGMTDEEVMHIAEVACRLGDVEDGTYDLKGMTREQLNLLVKTRTSGLHPEQNKLSCSASWGRYSSGNDVLYRKPFLIHCYITTL